MDKKQATIKSLNDEKPTIEFKPLKTVDDLVMGELTLGQSGKDYVYRKRFDGQQIGVGDVGVMAKKSRQTPAMLYYPKLLAYSTLVNSYDFRRSMLKCFRDKIW
jgi:hypothetical protein